MVTVFWNSVEQNGHRVLLWMSKKMLQYRSCLWPISERIGRLHKIQGLYLTIHKIHLGRYAPRQAMLIIDLSISAHSLSVDLVFGWQEQSSSYNTCSNICKMFYFLNRNTLQTLFLTSLYFGLSGLLFSTNQPFCSLSYERAEPIRRLMPGKLDALENNFS